MIEKFDQMIVREKEKYHGNRINSYTCRKTSRTIYTYDVDEGATPAAITCIFCAKPTKRHIGSKYIVMDSSGHPKYLQTEAMVAKVTHIFYRPKFEDWEQMPDGPLKHHILNGGLLIREVTDEFPFKP